jgi:hypothetical protein
MNCQVPQAKASNGPVTSFFSSGPWWATQLDLDLDLITAPSWRLGNFNLNIFSGPQKLINYVLGTKDA